MAAISCVAAWYVYFLIAFHIKREGLISDVWIPILFSISNEFEQAHLSPLK